MKMKMNDSEQVGEELQVTGEGLPSPRFSTALILALTAVRLGCSIFSSQLRTGEPVLSSLWALLCCARLCRRHSKQCSFVSSMALPNIFCSQ